MRPLRASLMPMNSPPLRVLERCFHSTATPLLLLGAQSPHFAVVQLNTSMQRLLGVGADDLVGQPWWSAFGADHPFASLQHHLHAGEFGEAMGCCPVPAGEPLWLRCAISPIEDDEARVTHFICTVDDVTASVAAERMRDFLAAHDPVTGLMRRQRFEERLGEQLLLAINGGQRLFVCHVNVDRFNHVNEIHGFRIGDQLIRQIAERLSGQAQADSLLCRFAGDEFIAVVMDAAGSLDQFDVGQQLLSVFVPPVTLDAISIQLTASVGVSCFPDTASSAQDLIQQASAAARVVKGEGGGGVHVFTTGQRNQLDDRRKLGPALRGAARRGELVLRYQPIVSAVKRRVTGMEALIRWQHPELGLLAPDRFIRLAEDFGLIGEIGQWVLNQACQQARRWLEAGVGNFVISVNVSGLQLQGYRLQEDVSRALNAARLPARFLELEITENVVMDNVAHVIALMTELRKIGVSLAIDDFGLGYSSLAHLRRFPISRLKIDRSFVAEVSTDISAARVCRAVISLAHELGHTVIAEGVETSLQLAFLERHGCEFIQGHYFGGPVPADDMLAMLRRPEMRVEDSDAPRGDVATILLVDDEQNVLRALARLLRRDGYRILTAGGFQEALDHLGANTVDLILSDQRMPDGKGTEFLGKIKETYPDTIRMILSGYADLSAVTDAVNGGAIYRFLTKPWDDDELRKTIRDALRRASPDAGDLWPDADGQHSDLATQ
jgi:diguanylate cyclase (GGDEF)-like protein/PAS domain S-box-containing protein